jgi:UDP-N-acetylmuramyl tripeptide synthase
VRQSLAVIIGKCVYALTKLRGGGSAFPGLVALRIAPRLLQNAFTRVPRGIVFVLGSNGKSTTTHMVSQILRGHGLKVFTNPTGANLPQGVASSLLRQVGARGVVRADIAVLEVDEAFAVELAEILAPRVVLGLNTQVDQLYRFIDTERAGVMMLDAMSLASEAIVTNRDDPFLSTVDDRRAAKTPRVVAFGVASEVVAASPNGLLNAQNFADRSRVTALDVVTEVTALTDSGTTLRTRDMNVALSLPARGMHYAVDAAAAVTTVQQVLGEDWSADLTAAAFAAMKPAYGRGEVLPFDATDVTFVMFKNMASLQLNLDALPHETGPVMVAIDEGTPDMSWIYDVRFDALRHVDVISGDKCWQMANCLAMKGVTVDLVEPRVEKAVARMRELVTPGVRQTWVVNYEITMIARKLIGFSELASGS